MGYVKSHSPFPTLARAQKRRHLVCISSCAMGGVEQEQKLSAHEEVRILRAQLELLLVENAQLRSESFVDELTGLRNRRGLLRELDRTLSHAERYGGPASLLALDLDGMKQINDTLGHPEGDRALKAVGQVLESLLRGSDLAGRFGGDEYVVLLPATGSEGATRVAERIRVAIEKLVLPEGQSLSASIGVVTSEPCHRLNRDQLLQLADASLYRAKRAGKNRVFSSAHPDTIQDVAA